MLEEAGSVMLMGDKVRLVRHAFVPGSDALDKIQVLGTDVAELIATIDHNLTTGPDKLLFQRKVAYDNIDSAALPKLKKMTFTKAQALLEQLDREYAGSELGEDDGDSSKYISLGIYYYEEDSSGK